MEGDGLANKIVDFHINFNPLPPHGGRRNPSELKKTKGGISIHSLRMEGDVQAFTAARLEYISIHSLRMEGDYIKEDGIYGVYISIHSLRMEGDIEMF